MKIRTILLAGLISILSLSGCDPENKQKNEAPVLIGGPGTLQAYVGQQVTVQVVATDVDSETLTFSFRAPTIRDWQTRPNPPTMTAAGPKSAYFRFTPTAMDVGDHFVDLVVSDGKVETSGVLTLRVQASTGSNPYPVFVAPIGSGATLDLAQENCFNLHIEVEDADSPSVDITLEEPLHDGYKLNTTDGSFTGTFTWCPSPKQMDESDRFSLNLKADDREGHVTHKRYILLLRREAGTDCPGTPPVIQHTAQTNLSSVNDVEILFQVTDDLGVFDAPIVYYSTQVTDPQNYNIISLTPVASTFVSGTRQNGQYRAVIPNPVVQLSPNESRTLYYVIEAVDDDDTEGKCDNRTTAPAQGMFQTTVTHPAGTITGAGLCEPCTADVQCGSTNDACVVLGMGQTRCLVDCQDNPDGCPGGTVCSVDALIGVSGLTRRQCVPSSGFCVSSGTCTADTWEENDTPSPSLPAITEGTISGLTMCMDPTTGLPDPDWFRFVLNRPSLTLVELRFLHSQGDLDLRVRNTQNQILGQSMSVTNNELVLLCLQPATYYIEVFTWDEEINTTYSLVFETIEDGCCLDDEWEPSNSPAQAIPVLSGDIIDDLTICSGDEDWFSIQLQAGDILFVELLFDQLTDSQDLDVYVYGTNGTTNLTPCCDPNNGQSGTSNEELLFQAPATGTYYVVVDGFYGSENEYIISFEIW